MSQMILRRKWQRAMHVAREQGVLGFAGWAWRWLYWNGQVHRLASLLAGLAGRVGRLWRELRSPRRTKFETDPPVCESVRVWVESQPALTYRLVGVRQEIARNPPRTVEAEVHDIFLQRLRFEAPERYFTFIPHARLAGASGIVILPDGSQTLELFHGSRKFLTQQPEYRSLPARTRRLSGRYFSLMLLWADAGIYYHWIHDVLLRLHRVAELLPPDVRFIVPAGLKPYQYETLRLFNLRPDQLLHFVGDEVWELESLYFAPPVAKTGHDMPEADRWFCDKVLSAYQLTPGGSRHRIYISRRLARARQIVNEAEVTAYLQRYGFVTCVLENLSFHDQASLFSHAEIVVAAHGSGLTNVLFAPPGLRLVDIFEPSYLNYAFWTMSEALCHQYWYFLGETVPFPEGRGPNIRVPLEKLAATLERIHRPA